MTDNVMYDCWWLDKDVPPSGNPNALDIVNARRLKMIHDRFLKDVIDTINDALGNVVPEANADETD